MGIKVDAVPGRLNQVVTIANNLGIFYGHVQNYVVYHMVLCQLK